MEDEQIVELYRKRDDAAIAETQAKYGAYCYTIARQILQSHEDAEECVNDAYMGAWNSIPPHSPELLSVYLGKITRQLSLKRYRDKSAQKRGGGSTACSLSELEECIPSESSIDSDLESSELSRVLDEFLGGLPDNERRVFVCRYWYFDSIRDIAHRFGYGQSKVKMMLKRTRDRLRARLEKEGIWI